MEFPGSCVIHLGRPSVPRVSSLGAAKKTQFLLIRRDRPIPFAAKKKQFYLIRRPSAGKSVGIDLGIDLGIVDINCVFSTNENCGSCGSHFGRTCCAKRVHSSGAPKKTTHTPQP